MDNAFLILIGSFAHQQNAKHNSNHSEEYSNSAGQRYLLSLGFWLLYHQDLLLHFLLFFVSLQLFLQTGAQWSLFVTGRYYPL